MKILVLNGSPRSGGNTAAMVNAFVQGAKESGHGVTVVDVAHKKIAGCLGCEFCHTRGNGRCVQEDGMQALYPLAAEAEMLVLASPIYYFGLSGQLECAIHRTYAIGIPGRLKKAALFLSSGASDVYDGAIYEYRNALVRYMRLEDMGVFTAHGAENQSRDKLEELRAFGRSLK